VAAADGTGAVAAEDAGLPAGERVSSTRWGTTALLAFAVIAFGLAGARPTTTTCPPPVVADGLPQLPDAPGASSTRTTPQLPTAVLIGERQVVNLTIQYPCYYPDQITVKRGVPVEFNVGAVGEPGCGRQLVLQGLGIGKYVPPGKIATFEFTPQKAGAFGMNCGMSMMKPGRLSGHRLMPQHHIFGWPSDLERASRRYLGSRQDNPSAVA
jgi:hypothetical protein